MRLIIFFLFILVSRTQAVAQNVTLDVSDPGSSNTNGAVRFNNLSQLGQKQVNNIEYSEVRGKYLWDENWNPAIVLLKGGNSIKVKNAKLNLYTNQLHFLDKDGNELAANPGLVKKVMVYAKTDSSKIAATFQTLVGLTKDNKEHFFQVLNDGKLQLLKVNLITVRKSDYDPLLGRSELNFISNVDYFLKDSSSINPLKGLSKSSLLSKIKLNEISENWLKSTTNKLKTEQEIVSLLIFLNNQN